MAARRAMALMPVARSGEKRDGIAACGGDFARVQHQSRPLAGHRGRGADHDVGLGAIVAKRFGPPAPSRSSDRPAARHSPVRRSDRSRGPPHRANRAVAVAQQPARGGITVLRRTRKMQQPIRSRASRWSAHRAPPAYRAGARSAPAQCPASTGSKPQPAPAAPPDRQPQSAQRDQHQRRQAERPAPASPRPAGRRQSGPSPASRRCPSPADAAAHAPARTASPRRSSAAAGITTKPITGMASRLPSTA